MRLRDDVYNCKFSKVKVGYIDVNLLKSVLSNNYKNKNTCLIKVYLKAFHFAQTLSKYCSVAKSISLMGARELSS